MMYVHQTFSTFSTVFSIETHSHMLRSCLQSASQGIPSIPSIPSILSILSILSLHVVTYVTNHHCLNCLLSAFLYNPGCFNNLCPSQAPKSARKRRTRTCLALESGAAPMSICFTPNSQSDSSQTDSWGLGKRKPSVIRFCVVSFLLLPLWFLLALCCAAL